MNVLLIHQVYAAPDEPGGTRHHELASHCVEDGLTFTIVASDVNYKTGRKIDAAKPNDSTAGITVIRAWTPATVHGGITGRLLAFLGFSLSSLIAALRAPEVDIFLGTSPPMFQAASAWLASTLRRRPFVLEIRDLWPDALIQGGDLRSRLAIHAFLALERFLYGRASHIVVNSPAYKPYLAERKHVPADRITIVPNGVETSQFSPESRGDGFRLRYGLQGKFVALYAGALGVANDIPTIVEAAYLLGGCADIAFVIVGDGDRRSESEQLVSDQGLANVVFVDAQPKTAMPEVLAAADVCLATLKPNPNYSTVYPNKVFDYMAAGRPTVFSIDGVIRDVLDAANAGLYVPPRDPRTLAEAVLQLHTDPDLAARMGRAARSYVEEHFERRTHAAILGGVLRHIVSRGGLSGRNF